ncbi:unnamed protein product [Brachionus calyciflorus]|uniref:Uncharacterized protein n=1 Tax=Brachionus calyciflorus TaxID=104777 RepID=A0A814FGR7_9BILA|nr:unnamed protein product [Brachionus calyciflorus]
MPYELRLKELEIQPLVERRERGNLIKMFIITKGIESVNLIKGINFKNPTNKLAKLRGHKIREIVRNFPSRYNIRIEESINGTSSQRAL